MYHRFLFAGLLILGASAAPCWGEPETLELAALAPAAAVPVQPPVVKAAIQPPVVKAPVPQRMRVRVTACSPFDSAVDMAYYARYGYEGAAYGIAADPRVFPEGTRMRVPGYRQGPGQGSNDGYWTVDSKGGPVIRASTRRGIKHIDVKFKTLYSVNQWGSRWLTVEVLPPPQR